MNDPHDLARFVTAQDPIYGQVLRELEAGAKRSHWMWFVFPQIAGLGLSATSRHYAISCLEEAHSYLHHPVLGPRLRDCTALVNHVQGRSIHQIFGSPDDMKFHSSMTLFARAAEAGSVFDAALRQAFAGVPDPATQARLP